ncbi:MAG TPA: hypothetical protein VNO33_23160 [Kofleriaceae bacterium]|nr:hypothetical protein [Kofleriaceae bacterium]
MSGQGSHGPKQPGKSFSDADLMMYADGELPADEARAVADWLAAEPAARLKLESLRQVGEAVRTYTELETDRAEVEVPAFADMWSRIERRIHANGAGQRAPARAAAEDREPVRTRRESGGPAGWWAGVRRWFEDHRGHVLTGAISAGAACALMLALGPTGEVQIAGEGKRPDPVQRAVLASQPPEVEDLEVYEGSGTILTIEPEGKDDSGAAVIWISSDQEQNREGPI